MPAIYSKFIEDKVLTEQEASEQKRHGSSQSTGSDGQMTEHNIKQL